MHEGFWNGEPAKFHVVNLIVADQTQESKDHFEKFNPGRKQYLWYKAFVGEVMQAIEVHYGDSDPFYLANIDGTGLYKVTDGMGSPQCGHKSINCEKVVNFVAEEDWIHISKELIDKVNQEVEDWWINEVGSEEYLAHKERMEALKAVAQGGFKP